jgi:hypothetical protein
MVPICAQSLSRTRRHDREDPFQDLVNSAKGDRSASAQEARDERSVPCERVANEQA